MKKEYKKIIICFAVIVCVVMSVIVVNANNTIKNSDDINITEIKSAIEGSQMINDIYASEDGSDDEISDSIVPFAAFFVGNSEPQYDIDNAFKVYYNNSDISGLTSLYDGDIDDYNYIVPIKQGKDIIALSTLKQGKMLYEYQYAIDTLSIPEEEKQKVIDTIISREGKWYEAYMEEINDESYNMLTLDINKVNSLLKENEIDNIKDYRYINLKNSEIKCLDIKTETNEYVIPCNLKNIEKYSLESKLYTVSDFLRAIIVEE